MAGTSLERPIGRDAEAGDIARFLTAVEFGPAALVLEGPAGIGKTTLWAAAVGEARSRGFQVAVARPSGAEAGWSYQSLADLLAAVGPADVAELPPPQRRAIEVALLQRDLPADDAAGPAEAQAVVAGVTSLFTMMARRAPVLLGIDDAPWLDHATASVLRGVLRRSGAPRLGVLLAQRVESAGPAPLEIDDVLPTERLWVGPMRLGALHLLLAERLGLTLPRPTLNRLHGISGGNPLHALEIGRALQRLERFPAPGDPLPVPRSLRALIEGRLAQAPTTLRPLLLAVAGAGELRSSDLPAAVGGDPEAALDEAVVAGILAIEDGVIRFAHPAFAAAAATIARPAERRAAHARLARVADHAEARARHLALATLDADAAVAAELEAAAGSARHRGATEEAAELARLAVDRTPAVDPAGSARRRLLLADLLIELPDLDAAAQVLDRLIASLPQGRERAEARLLRGTVAWYTTTSREAAAFLEAALSDVGDAGGVGDAGDAGELRGRLHYRLSIFYDYDLPSAVRHAGAAVAELDGSVAPVTAAGARFQRFLSTIMVGETPDPGLLEAGLALEAQGGSSADRNTVPGIWWIAVERTDLARERFASMLAESRDAGEASGEADLLTRLAETELYADRWTVARSYADEAAIVAQQEGQAHADPARRIRALIDAHEGRPAEARSVAEAGFARASAIDEPILVIAWAHALAFAAASAEDAAGTVRACELADAACRASGIVEPLRMDVAPEWIEALVELGRLDEAERLIDAFEARAQRVPRPWADAAIARGRARVLASRGRLEGAIAATDAVTTSAAAGWRGFDVARTLLVRGEVLRTARSRRDAGATLEAALSRFDALGARGWAARTQRELDRLGRRRSTSGDLTPTEQRVAELTASGLRNREVAEVLGISAKTVEAHLARVYGKLGIRSRAELGRMVGPDGG